MNPENPDSPQQPDTKRNWDQSAILVQDSSAGGMFGGRRGGCTILRRPALLSIGGLIWQSPIPETKEQADFINSVVERIQLPKS